MMLTSLFGSARSRLACFSISAGFASAPESAAASSVSSGIVPQRKYDSSLAIS